MPIAAIRVRAPLYHHTRLGFLSPVRNRLYAHDTATGQVAGVKNFWVFWVHEEPRKETEGGRRERTPPIQLPSAYRRPGAASRYEILMVLGLYVTRALMHRIKALGSIDQPPMLPS